MSKLPRQIDSRIEIVTPENIAFHYMVAGPFRRLPAYLIDLAFRAASLIAMSFMAYALGFAGASGLGTGLLLIGWFVLSWFYGGLFETFWNGQTPGKRLMRLRVLSVDGQPINAAQAVLRNVLRDVDALPIVAFPFALPLYMLGLTVTALNDRFQRLGDMAAGTIVVIEHRSLLQALVPVGDAEVMRLAAQLPVGYATRRSMAQALSVYASRRTLFSAGRRREIARTLAEPLCKRLGLPPSTDPDLLLCAVYYRTFITDRFASGEAHAPVVTAEASAP